MDMPRNSFKRRLATRQWQVGLFVGMANACSMEILAGAGFDWLVIDAEHSPNNPASVLAQLQAAAAYPVQVLVRPMSHDPALIKQYLDAGAQTLLLPMVDDAAQAHRPGAGHALSARGHPRRRRFDGARGALEWRHGLRQTGQREVCLVVQVETRQGLEKLDGILAVEGVDAVFIGPADLAASLGHLGESGHPEVRAAIEDALRRIVAAGKAAGVFVTDPDLAARYRDLGREFRCRRR
jgi:4-hydroxy-2-oxoheptanedioate aldolase